METVFAKKLRQLRKQKNIGQNELADKIGVNIKQIGRWERGENIPQIDAMRLLSRELEFDFFSLLSEDQNLTLVAGDLNQREIFMMASIKAISNEIAKIKTNVFGGDLDRWMSDLQENTNLIEIDLRKGLKK